MCNEQFIMIIDGVKYVNYDDANRIAKKLNNRIFHLEAELEKHRWISVDERLPDDNSMEYLWYCNKPDKEILLFGDPELFYEGGYNFTHWRPITLPKQIE